MYFKSDKNDFFFGKVKALSKFIKKIKDLEPSVFHFF